MTLAQSFINTCEGELSNLIVMVRNNKQVAAVAQSVTSDHAVIRFIDASRILVAHDHTLTSINKLN